MLQNLKYLVILPEGPLIITVWTIWQVDFSSPGNLHPVWYNMLLLVTDLMSQVLNSRLLGPLCQLDNNFYRHTGCLQL